MANAKSKAKKRSWKQLILGLTITIIVISTGVAVFTLPTVDRTLALATTRQPEPFTELFFNDNANLPVRTTAGNTITVSYSIINHEGQTTIYHPTVKLIENGHATLLSQSTIILSDRDQRSLPIVFSIAKNQTTYQLDVTLPERNLTIHFQVQS